MESGNLVVDLSDGTTVILRGHGITDAAEAAQVRSELRRLARAAAVTDQTETRSSDPSYVTDLGITLGNMILSGVVGNAAWLAFPKAAEVIARLRGRGTVRDVTELTAAIRDAIDPGTHATHFQVVDARRSDTGDGWQAVVEIDTRIVAVTTDASGRIVVLKQQSPPP